MKFLTAPQTPAHIYMDGCLRLNLGLRKEKKKQYQAKRENIFAYVKKERNILW
jgi:hypothetical protein